MKIYGKNPVKEILTGTRKIHKVYLLNNFKDAKLIKEIEKKNIQIEYTKKAILDKMADGAHQGIVAEVEDFKYQSMQDIFDNIREDEQGLIVILDHLEDPHNLGAIIRTVDAVGAHGVIIPKNRSVGLTPTVLKSSTGALEYVPVHQVTNLVNTIDYLKKQGYWVVGTDAHGSSDYRAIDYDMPVVLIIGSEGKGMSNIVSKACDFKVNLPMRGHVNSLNASVSAAILMYEIMSKRNPL